MQPYHHNFVMRQSSSSPSAVAKAAATTTSSSKKSFTTTSSRIRRQPAATNGVDDGDGVGGGGGGTERYQNQIQAGLLLLSIFYGSIYYLNPNIVTTEKYCIVVDIENNNSDDGPPLCRRPDLVAYKVTSVLGMSIMGLIGIYNWHCSARMKELGQSSSSDNDHKKLPNSELRLFGSLPVADRLKVIIFCYQLYDVVVSLTIPEYVEPIFLVHHVVAAITSWISLEYNLLSYYSIFFGGCSEFSSIFLVIADLDDFLAPPLPRSLHIAVAASKGFFILAFVIYRVIGWWWCAWQLWSDSLWSLRSGVAERLRPGKSSLLYYFHAVIILLGVLQLYWLVLIGLKLIDILA